MRVSVLILIFVLFTSISFAQKTVEKKKEVIIIKTDDKLTDIDKLIKKFTDAGADSVDVDLEVTQENGTTINKYIIKTMKDGKLNIEEIVEKVSDESMQKGGNQKKIMIIDTDDTQMDGAADSVSVNVEVKEIGDGAKKKIVIKTIKDGKEEVQEILMDAEDGENIIKEGGMEKRIMILDSKDGEIKNMNSEEDIQVFVKELSDGDRDSIQVRVEYNDDGEDNFTWFSKDEMEFPAPKVRMGVMLDESVVIDGIVEGSVAEAAGLQKGDKILKIDKQVIYSVNGLLEHLTSYDEGDKAKITFERNGEQMTKKIQF